METKRDRNMSKSSTPALLRGLIPYPGTGISLAFQSSLKPWGELCEEQPPSTSHHHLRGAADLEPRLPRMAALSEARGGAGTTER